MVVEYSPERSPVRKKEMEEDEKKKKKEVEEKRKEETKKEEEDVGSKKLADLLKSIPAGGHHSPRAGGTGGGPPLEYPDIPGLPPGAVGGVGLGVPLATPVSRGPGPRGSGPLTTPGGGRGRADGSRWIREEPGARSTGAISKSTRGRGTPAQQLKSKVRLQAVTDRAQLRSNPDANKIIAFWFAPTKLHKLVRKAHPAALKSIKLEILNHHQNFNLIFPPAEWLQDDVPSFTAYLGGLMAILQSNLDIMSLVQAPEACYRAQTNNAGFNKEDITKYISDLIGQIAGGKIKPPIISPEQKNEWKFVLCLGPFPGHLVFQDEGEDDCGRPLAASSPSAADLTYLKES